MYIAYYTHFALIVNSHSHCIYAAPKIIFMFDLACYRIGFSLALKQLTLSPMDTVNDILQTANAPRRGYVAKGTLHEPKHVPLRLPPLSACRFPILELESSIPTVHI